MKRFLTAFLMLILVSPAFAADSELKNLTEVTTADGTYLLYTTTAAGASRYSTVANLLTDANLPNDLTINSTKTVICQVKTLVKGLLSLRNFTPSSKLILIQD